jgi:1-phosphofructokinase family hexose kinase
MIAEFRSIVTVTLNPTIDRIIEVPGFNIGGHQQGRLRVRKPAGKAINVSRALSELGVRNSAIGWVGMNAFDLFHEAMQTAGVKACFLPITGATRENITIIDPQSHAETHIRDAGPTVDTADVRRLTDLLQTVASEQALIIFTGSLPPGLPMDAFDKLLASCTERGALVAIDTAGDPLRVAVERKPWLLKPNDHELAEFMGCDRTDEAFILQAGRQLNERIAVVLVTAGRRGAYCFAEGKVLHAQTSLPSDAVQSTVGCGDAMMAGFLSGLIDSKGDIETALREGVVISAAAAMTDEPARFVRADVERIRRKLELRAIG